LADCPCNFGRRTEETGASRDIGKRLVDGNPLDEGREIIDHLDGGIAQPLVVLEMTVDKSELRTEFARLPSRHATADPEGLGFIRSPSTTPPPTAMGLPRKEGSSSCSTEA